ncbi:divalent-cation tolerance protein CutA [Maritimibacter sp. DP1N21-5]|uniref:divalent-cation tolerance protein CutA n=1 Tax=Maritimibacter sp. DP1N21-5 TaxID=2836867 RepID=UPI001C474B03|nr:divalent-cation tolerance protein CutA [Maritimibacter sp. DP1N21-5]MBV7409882.1 divalent-cation tolerance protein CutA [Maritimibacter sp. DP1N21-5]
MTDAVELQVTFPDARSAQDAARAAVENQLAACAQITQVQSLYLWQDVIQNDAEWLVTFKTLAAAVPDLSGFLRDIHPYDVPQMTALPVVWTTEDYLGWIARNVRH